MPIVTIRFPTKEEEERSHRFTVHRNYLGSIELFLGALYAHGDDQARGLIDTQRALPAFGRIQRRPMADVAELRRLLAISWASETQVTTEQFWRSRRGGGSLESGSTHQISQRGNLQ